MVQLSGLFVESDLCESDQPAVFSTHIFHLQLLDTGSSGPCESKRVVVNVLLEDW